MQTNINSFKHQSLTLPKSISSSEDSIDIQNKSSVVVVGANGSGKTRFGSWIDLESPSPQKSLVHRIGAQKSLSIPEYFSTSSIDAAEQSLLYGHYQHNLKPEQIEGYKNRYRWQSKPSTHLQSDYDKLLVYLFTEEFEKSTKYRQQSRATGQLETPPETYLDIIKRIWEFVLPHRQLIVGAGKIEAQPRNGGTSYHASEMSDGERVIFYLIGQCLAVKKNGIVVVDEPELHLHKALQSRLWDAIEAERPDCLFVYLTHDLDFAVTRVNARKIWLKSYENNQWDWYLIPESEDIPERLLLEIIGSRQPILFVEGDRNSLDFFIFSHLFKDFTVTPCGSASVVIHATRSFSNLKHIHSLECKGIIDRDRRLDEEINNLKCSEIFCLDVSEIENVFLSEEVLRVVAASLSFNQEDTNSIIKEAKSIVFRQMKGQKETVISAIIAAHIEKGFLQFNAKARGETELKKSLENMLSKINITSLYTETSNTIDAILDSEDYSAALRLYNNKGLLAQVSSVFGFKSSKESNQLIDCVKRLILSKRNEVIIGALQKALPELSSLNFPAKNAVSNS